MARVPTEGGAEKDPAPLLAVTIIPSAESPLRRRA